MYVVDSLPHHEFKAHGSCLKFDDRLTANVLTLTDWECNDCKRCTTCKEVGDDVW